LEAPPGFEPGMEVLQTDPGGKRNSKTSSFEVETD
jgi:hypothetical protein